MLCVMSTIQEMRREYGKGALRESDVAASPFEQFQRWFSDAVASNKGDWFEPNALSLATCGKDGVPSVRIVLLKDFDERGFVFYTNYASEKGRHLAENPVASLLFHWPDQERQVRITGDVTKVSREETEAYFSRRPRTSQIGASASTQTATVPDRAFLEERFAELDKLYEGKPVPTPAEWGGYRVSPRQIEFWQGQASRLHDRLLYTREGNAWKIVRLSP